MIIVPSLTPSTVSGGRRLLRQLSGRVALVELRLDGSPIRRVRDVRRLLGGKRPPVMVTYRSRAEGGKFHGSPTSALSRLEEALAAGAEFIDVEERLGGKRIARLIAIGGGSRIVLSRHDPLRTPRNAPAVFRRMMKHRPAIVKYACRANSFGDTLQAARLLKQAARAGQPAAVLSMGEYGTYTRVLQGFLGGALSFAPLDPERPTAPGQVGFGEMGELYRANAINARTKIFGLVGDPVAFSPGALFHNGVFSRLNHNAVYLKFLVDDLGAFMSSVGRICTGLSVTMPFKSAVIPFLDRLHSSATICGSVNTIIRRGGRTLGINTDFLAFTSLLKKAISPRGKKLLVIGSGGTARSAAAAGARAGSRLTVTGRTPSKGRRLAAEFGGSWVPLPGIADVGADIIVNATPVGMETPSGRATSGRIVPLSVLRRSTVVCDFANPPHGATLLVREARAVRCTVISGAGIFRAQASLQSRRFLASERPA